MKGKMKRHRLMKEEILSSKIGDASNDVRFSDLYSFGLHSKRQIIYIYILPLCTVLAFEDFLFNF